MSKKALSSELSTQLKQAAESVLKKVQDKNCSEEDIINFTKNWEGKEENFRIIKAQFFEIFKESLNDLKNRNFALLLEKCPNNFLEDIFEEVKFDTLDQGLKTLVSALFFPRALVVENAYICKKIIKTISPEVIKNAVCKRGEIESPESAEFGTYLAKEFPLTFLKDLVEKIYPDFKELQKFLPKDFINCKNATDFVSQAREFRKKKVVSASTETDSFRKPLAEVYREIPVERRAEILLLRLKLELNDKNLNQENFYQSLSELKKPKILQHFSEREYEQFSYCFSVAITKYQKKQAGVNLALAIIDACPNEVCCDNLLKVLLSHKSDSEAEFAPLYKQFTKRFLEGKIPAEKFGTESKDFVNALISKEFPQTLLRIVLKEYFPNFPTLKKLLPGRFSKISDAEELFQTLNSEKLSAHFLALIKNSLAKEGQFSEETEDAARNAVAMLNYDKIPDAEKYKMIEAENFLAFRKANYGFLTKAILEHCDLQKLAEMIKAEKFQGLKVAILQTTVGAVEIMKKCPDELVEEAAAETQQSFQKLITGALQKNQDLDEMLRDDLEEFPMKFLEKYLEKIDDEVFKKLGFTKNYFLQRDLFAQLTSELKDVQAITPTEECLKLFASACEIERFFADQGDLISYLIKTLQNRNVPLSEYEKFVEKIDDKTFAQFGLGSKKSFLENEKRKDFDRDLQEVLEGKRPQEEALALVKKAFEFEKIPPVKDLIQFVLDKNFPQKDLENALKKADEKVLEKIGFNKKYILQKEERGHLKQNIEKFFLERDEEEDPYRCLIGFDLFIDPVWVEGDASRKAFERDEIFQFINQEERRDPAGKLIPLMHPTFNLAVNKNSKLNPHLEMAESVKKFREETASKCCEMLKAAFNLENFFQEKPELITKLRDYTNQILEPLAKENSEAVKNWNSLKAKLFPSQEVAQGNAAQVAAVNQQRR